MKISNKPITVLTALNIAIFILSIGCGGNDSGSGNSENNVNGDNGNSDPLYTEGSGVTDIDGNEYASVVIGDQEWMAQNLRTSTYANDDPIEHVEDNDDWISEDGAWCHYENDSDNADVYGKLYNWPAVDDDRGLCPQGWQVPSEEDWQHLEIYLGMNPDHADDESERGADENVGTKLKSDDPQYWGNADTNSNRSGLSLLPGGHRLGFVSIEGFLGAGGAGYWWTATEGSDPQTASARYLESGKHGVMRGVISKGYGLSVRCIKD